MFAGKKSAQIREILISESAWEEMTCLFAPSLETPCASHAAIRCAGEEQPARNTALISPANTINFAFIINLAYYRTYPQSYLFKSNAVLRNNGITFRFRNPNADIAVLV